MHPIARSRTSWCLQESAVRDFNTVEDIRVFLLHAGQAAAGLTLTAAAHVFLMEPMLKEGEELQAMNRCCFIFRHAMSPEPSSSTSMTVNPRTCENSEPIQIEASNM
jgi:hypothetical protein